MKNYKVTVNGTTYDVSVETVDENQTTLEQTSAKSISSKSVPKEITSKGEKVMAPMPGTVLNIKVNEHDTVKAGDTILVLEAMKMENDIVSPCDGEVSSILIKAGDTVNSNDVLAYVINK